MYYYALKNSKKPKWKSLTSKTEKEAIIELSHGLIFTKSKHVVEDYLIITEEQLKPFTPKCFHEKSWQGKPVRAFGPDDTTRQGLSSVEEPASSKCKIIFS
jgi:hypothetical protein